MPKKYRITLILLLILSGVFALFVSWNNQKVTDDVLLTNDVEFSGKIIGLKVSNNHLFGIITVKIDSTNTQEFLSLGTTAFPYQIKDSMTKIYHYTSSYLQKG